VNVIRSARIALVWAPLACGGGDGSADATGRGSSTSTEPHASGSSGDESVASTSHSEASSAADSSSGGSPSTTDGATSSTTTGEPADELGCPVAAPGSWIACEDFDAIDDAPTQLSQWNVNGDGFAVEPGLGVFGSQALRVRLQPGIMFGGWVTLRFGEGPDAPSIDAPDGRWDELWLRYRLRTGDDWPGRQIGDVGEMIAMNGANSGPEGREDNWAIAADLNLQGDGAMHIRSVGWSCIVDGEIQCDGTNDWAGALSQLWDAYGATPVFDAAHAGTWQCFEAHMRLDDPGAGNGEAHVWVDGVQEIERLDVHWRETWDDFGINAVRFTNYAEPVDAPLDFFIDDVVVATERIGCE
jgi:hypothetical protein